MKTGAPQYTVGEPVGDPYLDLGVESKVVELQIEDDIKPEELFLNDFQCILMHFNAIIAHI